MDKQDRPISSGVVAGEAFWVIVGQALAATGGLVGVRLLTARLEPHAYGELALGLTVGTLAQQVVLGPLGQAAMRYYAAACEARQASVYVSVVKDLTVKGALAATAVIAPAAIVLAALGHVTWALLTIAALILALLTGGNGIIDSLQTAARRRAVVALHQGAAQWLRPVLAVGLIMAVGAYSAAALLGYILAVLLVMSSQFRYLPSPPIVSREARPSSSRTLAAEYRTQLMRYSWPFSTWGLFTALQLTSDRWALNTFGDTHAVGVYVVSYQLGYQPLMLLSNAAAQLTAPLLFRKAGDGKDSARVNKALSVNQLLCVATVGATVLVVLAAYLLRRPIVALFCAPQYVSAANHIPWLVLAAGLFACGQTASNALLIACKTRSLITPKVVTAVCAVALNCLGAKIAGVTGVVAANLAFSVLYCGWILVLTAAVARGAEPQSEPQVLG